MITLLLIALLLTITVDADFYSFLKTGDIKCDDHRDFLIIASFQAMNGDVYLWSTDYMTRLRRFSDGSLRVYDTYPKSAMKWTVEDFPYPKNVTPTTPTVVYADNDGQIVTFFLSTDTLNEEKSLRFRYVTNSYVFDGYNAMDFSFINSHVDRQMIFYAFIVMGSGGNVRRRALYELSYMAENHTQFVDFEKGAIIIKGWLLYSAVVTGAVMISHGENWSIGYSFQGDYSVPLYVRLKPDDTDLFNVVDTKYGDSVGTSFHRENEFKDFGLHYRFIVPNSHWFGCGRDEWCYRGYIDEATTLWNNTLLVFSGRWIRVVKRVKDTAVQTKFIHEYYSLNIPNFIDAAFTDRTNKLTFILKDNKYYVLQYAVNSWFVEEDVTSMLMSSKNTITAMMFSNRDAVSEIFVFGVFDSNYRVMKAAMNNGNDSDSYFGIKAMKRVSELVDDLPFVVDAAFKDPESDSVFLVNSLFSYKIDGENFYNIRIDDTIDFQRLFGCSSILGNNPLGIDMTMYKKELKEGLTKDPFLQEQKFQEGLRAFYFIGILLLIVVIVVVVAVIHYKSKNTTRKEQIHKSNSSLAKGKPKFGILSLPKPAYLRNNKETAKNSKSSKIKEDP